MNTSDFIKSASELTWTMEKQATGNRAMRRLMEIVRRNPDALRNTDWFRKNKGKQLSLPWESGHIGTPSIGLPEAPGIVGRAERGITRRLALIKNPRFKARYPKKNDQQEMLYRLSNQQSDYIRRPLLSGHDRSLGFGYPKHTRKQYLNARPSRFILDAINLKKFTLSEKKALNDVREALKNSSDVLRYSGLDDAYRSALRDRSLRRIPIQDVGLSPDKHVWKGGQSAILTPSRDKLFFSAYPEVSSHYASGHILPYMARVPSHKLKQPLPPFQDGHQVVQPGRAFYTPHVSKATPASRRKAAEHAQFSGHLGRIGGPKKVNHADTVFQQRSNPTQSSYYETVGQVAKPVKARWVLGPDDKSLVSLRDIHRHPEVRAAKRVNDKIVGAYIPSPNNNLFPRRVLDNGPTLGTWLKQFDKP